jgi:hypothetical protein
VGRARRLLEGTQLLQVGMVKSLKEGTVPRTRHIRNMNMGAVGELGFGNDEDRECIPKWTSRMMAMKCKN